LFIADLLTADLGAAFAAVFAETLTAVFAGVLAATFAALFFSALRAEAGGATFARTGPDAFDFAAVFLSFEAALAMTCINPREEWELRAYTILNGPAQGGRFQFPGPKNATI
jgi:hypothetical protein